MMNDENSEPLVHRDEKKRHGLFRKIASIGGQLIVLFILVWLADLWLTRDAAHATPPDIVQRTIFDEPFSTEMLKGAPSLIHFWGTWCPVCNIEQSTIDSIAKKYPMVTVALQSGSDDEIAAYLVEKGVHYRVVNDNSGIISKSYGVTTVPMTFILDKNGEIKFVTQGYSSELGLRFKLWLASW